MTTQSTPNIKEETLEGYAPVRFGELNEEKMLRGDEKVKAKKFWTNEIESILFLFQFLIF